MNHEARLRKLEQVGKQKKIRYVTVEEDDPDRSEKILQAEKEARAAGEYLVIWDIVDGSL